MAEIGGGQVWAQRAMPYMRRYVTLLGGPGTRFALLSMPDRIGSCVCTQPDGTWSYSIEELRAHLDRYGYECLGQFAEMNDARTE